MYYYVGCIGFGKVENLIHFDLWFHLPSKIVVVATVAVQGCKNVQKDPGGACSYVVDIIFPPGWDRVNWSAKNRMDTCTNISYVMEFLAWWVLKSKVSG